MKFDEQMDTINEIKISSCGFYLLSVSSDGTLCVYDLRKQHTNKDHLETISKSHD